MPRIVTLLPSATEIVSALGFEADIVGRSHECDYPSSVTRLPVLTAPKLDVDGSSAEIDRRVKQIVGDALSVYRVDAELLSELRPDVIVTQSQCDVCAVSLNEVEEAVAQWTGRRPRIVSLAPFTLSDVLSDIERVAGTLDAPQRGNELTARLRRRMDSIADRANRSAACPRVACIEWIDPLMAAGNWIPELVEIAGGKSLFGEPGKHSPWLRFEDLEARNPDAIVVMPCGFDIDRSIAELRPLAARDGWTRLSAVREHQVFVTDGNQYFNRPGPRIVESLEIMAELLHPELFDFGHEGACWRRL